MFSLKLADWLDGNGWHDRRLADAIGVTGECVRLWRSGMRRPSTSHAEAIRQATAGEVAPEDLDAAYAAARKGG